VGEQEPKTDLATKLKDAAVSPEALRAGFGHVWGWLAVGGLTALGTLFWYVRAHHQPPLATAPVVAPAASTIDFQGYFAELNRLEGRWGEEEEFLKNLQGKTIRWRGYVFSVSGAESLGVSVVLSVSDWQEMEDPRHAIFYFPESMRTRLFALHRKDYLEVTGTFGGRGYVAPLMPSVQGETMEIIALASEVAPPGVKQAAAPAR